MASKGRDSSHTPAADDDAGTAGKMLPTAPFLLLPDESTFGRKRVGRTMTSPYAYTCAIRCLELTQTPGEDRRPADSKPNNPFKMPSDEEIFSLRDDERARKEEVASCPTSLPCSHHMLAQYQHNRRFGSTSTAFDSGC
eukprot:994718-Rhodomonas_salina.2